MQTQRTELLNHLPEYGWRVSHSEENLEWWADEMWLLESLWSPAGLRVYITFMVDPMAAPSRKKGEAVWAVNASLTKLTCPFSADREFTLSLGQGWKERLPDFFQHLSALRDRSNTESA